MKSYIRGLITLAVALCVLPRPAWALPPQQTPIRVSALDVGVSSISLPLPGNPVTGPITASLRGSAEVPQAYLDCDSNRGLLVWPVSVQFPLLQALGLPPIATTLIGPFKVDPLDPRALCGFDMAYVNHPALGQMFLSNYHNKNFKSRAVVSTLCSECGPGGTVTGSFEDNTQADFDRLGRDWLRGAMDVALAQLRSYDPSVPSIAPAILDSAYQRYVADPTKEILVYFPASGEFRTADLTGTDAISNLCGATVPTLSEWGAIIFGTLLFASVVFYIWRRRIVTA